MRLMRVPVIPVAVALAALLVAVPSGGEVVPEDSAPQVVNVYASNPASEISAPTAHINSAQVGWENVGAITRWNTVIGGDSIPDDDIQVGLWELAPRAIYAGHVCSSREPPSVGFSGHRSGTPTFAAMTSQPTGSVS